MRRFGVLGPAISLSLILTAAVAAQNLASILADDAGADLPVPLAATVVATGIPGAGASPVHGMYLLDTQPVVLGARYRYLLVRFKEDREIDQVIPTNEVEVTP